MSIHHFVAVPDTLGVLAEAELLELLSLPHDHIKSNYIAPTRIVKDKIGDVSIKLQFGVDEAWTRALRHVLLALKLLLKWTTSAAA